MGKRSLPPSFTGWSLEFFLCQSLNALTPRYGFVVVVKEHKLFFENFEFDEDREPFCIRSDSNATNLVGLEGPKLGGLQ